MCGASALRATGKEEENVIDRAQSSWTEQGEFYTSTIFTIALFLCGKYGPSLLIYNLANNLKIYLKKGANLSIIYAAKNALYFNYSQSQGTNYIYASTLFDYIVNSNIMSFGRVFWHVPVRP